MFDAASESRIIRPEQVNLVQQQPYQPRESWGAISRGDFLPWRGLWFAVVAIATRTETDALITLKPMKVTSGAVKKLTGKKGKKGAK